MGNDSAIDSAQIIDVTPQLDKAFSPASIQLGQVSRLTMTITNTTDLLRKRGWSFTDNLPAGLVVEGNASTTCPGATVQAAAGGSTVTVSNGDLAQGDRKSTRLNSSHLVISYAVFCLKKKNERLQSE